MIFVPFIILGFGTGLFLKAGGVDIPFEVLFIGFQVMFLCLLLGRCALVRKNQALDEEISQLCADLSSKTAGAARVEFRTEWTGIWKPPGAHSSRILAFVPMGEMQIPPPQGHTILVTVPEGATPGQNLQVQTPDGVQHLATIPAGVGPGQSFVFVPGAMVQAQEVAP